jgi:mobilization protein NikA
MGRPTKSEPRSQQFNLSLSISEIESIRRRAAALGMRPAHFGRELLLNQSRALPRSTEKSHVDRLIYSQLARLGNNLNQIVRHLNRTGDPLPADLEPLLNDIRQIIARGWRDDR